MKRYVFALSLAAAVVAPVLDSVFVGDTLLPRDVYLRDSNGVRHDPGPFKWDSNPKSVATVDSVTGRIVGVSKGSAVVLATVPGATSGAVVIVSRPLEMTPLMDTIYLMPGDTITVPLAIKQTTLPDSILDAGTFELDSISPQEATTPIGSLDPVCSPKRPWAVWASIKIDPQLPRIFAYSHGTTSTDSAGYLSITQYAPAVGGGAIISGRYLFRAQRLDLYGDPLGSETIRGTFVTPLRLRNICTA